MVRTISPGRADAPYGAFMIKVNGAFTCLGIRDRDSGLGRQIAQFLGGFRIDRAATGNNQGTLSRLNNRCRPRHLGFRYCRTAHVPYPLFKHFYRPIVRPRPVRLVALTSTTDSGFCRVGEDAHGRSSKRALVFGTVNPVEERDTQRKASLTRHVQRTRIL